MDEMWKDILNYEGKYQVSNFGNIRSLPRKYVSQLIPRKITKNRQGYSMIFLSNPPKAFSVHRLVALHFIPNPNNLPEVNHKDLNKQNNHIKNLEWTTSRNNTLHALAHGKVHGVKLDKEKAKEIRIMWKSGKYKQKQLSQLFKVGADEISRIVNYKIWKD